MKPKKTDTIDATLNLTLNNEPHAFNISVPKKRTSSQCVIKFSRELTNTIVDIAEHIAINEGKSVSCKKGCGACCSQLVPISPTEARYLARYISGLSNDKKSKLVAKFDHIETKLKSAGFWDTLIAPEKFDNSQIKSIGLDYFDLNLPCPFLEDNACSIHLERPLTCREFLATTPASNCSSPRTLPVETVDVPVKASKALGNIEHKEGKANTEWVALSTLLVWVKNHPEPPAAKTGPKWIEKLLAEFNQHNSHKK